MDFFYFIYSINISTLIELSELVRYNKKEVVI